MPGNPFTDPNWAPDLADTIERSVGKVRTLTTDNAVKVSRGVVFGVLALLVLIVAVPLLVILALGVLRELLGTFVSHGRAVWLSYMILGALMWIGGFVAFARRRGRGIA